MIFNSIIGIIVHIKIKCKKNEFFVMNSIFNYENI